MSWTSGEMIISMTSRGRVAAEDWGAGVLCEAIAERILQDLAKRWYQARLGAATIIVAKWTDEKY